MLPIRKHLRCSWLVPDQGVGSGARLGLSPGPPRPGSAALPMPTAGPGCPRRGLFVLIPAAAEMGMLGDGRGARGGQPWRGRLFGSPAGCVSALIRQTSVFIASPASGEFHN